MKLLSPKSIGHLVLALICNAIQPTLAQSADSKVPLAVPFSMEALTRKVLEHNPRYQDTLRLKDQSRAATLSSKALANPKLEWAQGQDQARVASAVPGSVQAWTLAQFIENPSARGSRIRAFEMGEQEIQYKVAMARQDLVADIQSRTYEYFLRRDLGRVLQDDYDLLLLVRDRIRIRVESGEAPRYELIKADAEVINARQRYQTASLQAEQVLLGINRLAAGNLPTHWLPEGLLGDDVFVPSLETLQAQAQELNPELMTIRSQVARLEHALQSTRASKWPGVELRYTQTTDAQLTQNVMGLQVQIPLLDQKEGPIAEQLTELNRMRMMLDGRAAELKQQIFQSWKALEIARSRIEALSKGAIKEAESALRVAQSAYRFGERGIIDVLDAQRVLQSVRIDLLEARYQLQAARIQLELLSGQYAQTNPS
jgi:cobalt-zinc-cadmium efflux system outer membrane protein